MIEICTVGGYDEVGRNMTAIKVDDEVIVIDMGVFMDKYIPFNNALEEGMSLNPNELIKAGAVPDTNLISDWQKMVKAIVLSHGHLDHVAGIPYLADRFKAPLICTEYTAEIIKAIAADQKLKLSNRINILNPNSTMNITKNIKIEFIQATHSIPQTVMIAIHTKYGTVLYTNDFKFDNSPILGKKPNYERLRELGKTGVLAVIMDSIYSSEAKKTPSEAVAREMLKEVMLGTESEGKLVIVTTFSSHIARLKSAVEFGGLMKRKIVFLGRSLSKYIGAAENIGIADFSKKGEVVRYSSQMRSKLNEIEKKGRHKYLLIATGHQGEPGSVLQKIVSGKLGFRLGYEDLVIFSCTVIPTDINRKNREDLEKALRSKGVRIFTDLHVSGHGAREDQRDLINMTKPKYIIPSHGPRQMVAPVAELAQEMGYAKDRVKFSHNGNRFKIG